MMIHLRRNDNLPFGQNDNRLRRMIICLRQNEGEFPQAEISDYIVKQVRTKRSTALFALIYIKLFSSAARKFTFHFAEGKLSFRRRRTIILAKRDYHSRAA